MQRARVESPPRRAHPRELPVRGCVQAQHARTGVRYRGVAHGGLRHHVPPRCSALRAAAASQRASTLPNRQIVSATAHTSTNSPTTR